ncbi:MAG: GMC oxidoreductase [Panacagrimonas sp.]
MQTQQNHHYDSIIVGSGAGGCAAAYRLVQAGQTVLLLERGERLPTDGSTLDTKKVLGEGAFKSKEVWIDGDGRRFAPEEFFNLGGKTQWYGAALARFGKDEFSADESRGFLSWPVGYDELSPYYDEAEALLGVQPFDIEPGLGRITRRLSANGAGWIVAPLPLGLSPRITDRPDQASKFDGFALLDGLKADAQHRLLGRVAGDAKLTVLTGAQVVNLLRAPDAAAGERIAGVVLADGREYFAARVLLAGGALHSPRLLQTYLRSAQLEQHLPVAVQVGRRYKRHVLTAVVGFGLRAQHDLLRKTTLLTSRRFLHSSVQPLGGWIDREIVRSMIPGFVPRFIAEFFVRRVYGFFLQTEDGSHDDNRVSAATGETAPTMDYRLSRLPAAGREHRGLVRAFVWSLLKAGFLPFAQRVPLEGSAHSVGTLTAGRDARDSVVDAEGRVHGIDNLYVVDGSVLPRIGRLNPALTIYAWSLRVADRLSSRSPTP